MVHSHSATETHGPANPDTGTLGRRGREAPGTAYARSSAHGSAESRTADGRTGTHIYSDERAHRLGYLNAQTNTLGHADDQADTYHTAGNLGAIATITHEDTIAGRR